MAAVECTECVLHRRCQHHAIVTQQAKEVARTVSDCAMVRSALEPGAALCDDGRYYSSDHHDFGAVVTCGDLWWQVSAAGLEDRGDHVHFTTDGYIRFGARYAAQWLRFQPPPK